MFLWLRELKADSIIRLQEQQCCLAKLELERVTFIKRSEEQKENRREKDKQEEKRSMIRPPSTLQRCKNNLCAHTLSHEELSLGNLVIFNLSLIFKRD